VQATAQSIDLVREHESGPTVRAALEAGRFSHLAARVSVVVICAMTLAGCSGITRTRIIPQTASSRKFVELKHNIPRPLPSATRSRIISQTANIEKFAQPKSRIPIPLPAASLLSPQPEPSCEITDTNADERQKLDYERQCYRQAEMIVRSRLQLLQESVDKTISAVKRSERSDP
jgi:hypothetical protein